MHGVRCINFIGNGDSTRLSSRVFLDGAIPSKNSRALTMHASAIRVHSRSSPSTTPPTRRTDIEDEEEVARCAIRMCSKESDRKKALRHTFRMDYVTTLGGWRGGGGGGMKPCMKPCRLTILDIVSFRYCRGVPYLDITEVCLI